jgi:2-polyprenyl-6-methoxyphenol hydroxylase-like FAD-dependent oxidoreductase
MTAAMPKSAVQNIPVAIAGGGPVGLLLALFLDFYGVRSVVFNSEPKPRHHPKGSTHNSRTMEHHRRLGIAPRVRELSLPIDRPTDVSYHTRLTGWELARLSMPSEAEKRRAVAAAAATDQVPEPLLRANQMYVETFLLAHARTRKNIAVHFGVPVTAFEEDDDGVTVQAEAVAGGERETWRAQYLVGCDGGRSYVRRALALRYHGFAKLDSPHYGGRMNATYLRAPTLYRDHLARRPGWIYWVINPEIRSPIISLNRDDEFLVFSKGSDEGLAPTDEAMAQLLRRAVGTDLPVEIIGHWPWTAGVALVAERFVAGRVTLAGDAAHLFTPTGGFGMNTGMDDAANLAWKLAALVQGWGGADLLKSYEIERRPIAERNTIAARELNKHLASMPSPAAMEEDSAAGAAARREVSAHLATMGEEFASLGVQLGARYDGSPIVADDGAPPADDFLNYAPSGVPGGRAPHHWLDAGRGYGSSLFDRLGAGFTLLRLGGKPADTSTIEAAAKKRGMPLSVLEVPQASARDLYGRDLALIRPDQYVAWRGNAPPADADRLIAQIVGAA